MQEICEILSCSAVSPHVLPLFTPTQHVWIGPHMLQDMQRQTSRAGGLRRANVWSVSWDMCSTTCIVQISTKRGTSIQNQTPVSTIQYM